MNAGSPRHLEMLLALALLGWAPAPLTRAEGIDEPADAVNGRSGRTVDTMAEPFDDEPDGGFIDAIGSFRSIAVPDFYRIAPLLDRAIGGLALGIGPQLLANGAAGSRFTTFSAGIPSGLGRVDRHSYALVGFAGYRGTRGWAIGPEAWVDGDSRYRLSGLGVAVHDQHAGPLRVDLRLGATRQLNLGRVINGGVELRWRKP